MKSETTSEKFQQLFRGRKGILFIYLFILQAIFFGEETEFLNCYIIMIMIIILFQQFLGRNGFCFYLFFPAIFVEEREFGFSFFWFYCGFSTEFLGGRKRIWGFILTLPTIQ